MLQWLPSWPLLLWSGVAATVISVWMLGALMPAAGARALAPGARSARALRALLLGIFLYPLFYGLGFELLRRASLLTGAALGAGHALLLLIPARHRPARASELIQRIATVIIYGALLGFAYVTP